MVVWVRQAGGQVVERLGLNCGLQQRALHRLYPLMHLILLLVFVDVPDSEVLTGFADEIGQLPVLP